MVTGPWADPIYHRLRKGISMPTLTCSSCGDPIPIEGDIAAELPKLPGGAQVRILCATCNAEAAPPPPTRTFTVSVLLRELIAGQEAVSEEDQIWEDVGGFTLRGTGASVREFAYDQAAEYQRRMEAILAFADQPSEVPGIQEKVEQALAETASEDLPPAPPGPVTPNDRIRQALASEPPPPPPPSAPPSAPPAPEPPGNPETGIEWTDDH
jgi:hypothetical protein